MRKREKTITAACRTTDGIEWTTLKISQDGDELPVQGSLPIVFPEDLTLENLKALELPEDLADHLNGEIYIILSR